MIPQVAAPMLSLVTWALLKLLVIKNVTMASQQAYENVLKNTHRNTTIIAQLGLNNCITLNGSV